MVMEVTQVPEPEHKFFPPLTESDREKLKTLIFQKVLEQPGITSPQLMDYCGAPLNEMKRAFRFLRLEGKIRDRGWEAVGHSSRTNVPSTDTEDSSGTNKLTTKDSSQDECSVKWKAPAGTAKTNYKYPWVYIGDQPLVYIGGGNQKNPVAIARVTQIEAWIRLGVPVEEIVERIKQMKTKK